MVVSAYGEVWREVGFLSKFWRIVAIFPLRVEATVCLPEPKTSLFVVALYAVGVG